MGNLESTLSCGVVALMLPLMLDVQLGTIAESTEPKPRCGSTPGMTYGYIYIADTSESLCEYHTVDVFWQEVSFTGRMIEVEDGKELKGWSSIRYSCRRAWSSRFISFPTGPLRKRVRPSPTGSERSIGEGASICGYKTESNPIQYWRREHIWK